MIKKVCAEGINNLLLGIECQAIVDIRSAEKYPNGSTNALYNISNKDYITAVFYEYQNIENLEDYLNYILGGNLWLTKK